MNNWYQMSKAEVLEKIGVTTDGLTSEKAKELLEKNGINERVLRLSVGIESAKDLIFDFERVFKGTREELYGREKS